MMGITNFQFWRLYLNLNSEWNKLNIPIIDIELTSISGFNKDYCLSKRDQQYFLVLNRISNIPKEDIYETRNILIKAR